MPRKKPRKNKKFRFQLLADWIEEHFPKCNVVDIGGGKGLLAYLLIQKGFECTVIDPFNQSLPKKYTDVHTKKRIKIPPTHSVPRIDSAFEKEMAKNFDLLVGLHVHGSCIKMIEASKEFCKNFVLMPCCVIDEPIVKLPEIKWTDSLIELAQTKGIEVKTDKLNVMGKSRIIYVDSF